MDATPSQVTTAQVLQATLVKLKANDPAAVAAISAADVPGLASMSAEQQRNFLIMQVQKSLDSVSKEQDVPGHRYHSRDPLGGLIQSVIQSVIDAYEDNVVPPLQPFGEGNPVAWVPTAIDGILEYFRGKAPFQVASPRSLITIPDSCRIALLSDWGADNDHARRIGDLAIEKGANYVIHLGDIYYSGTDAECRLFLEHWPLRDEAGKPKQGYSFAMNGNHEMYSQGRGYFRLVLQAFGQEASYFTLSNTHWQIHGTDSAYVPFSISGGKEDTRVAAQWEWLVGRIKESPAKKNILLTHHEPESAHIAEYTEAQALKNEWWELAHETDRDAVFAWFFGHEHRCAIYDDEQTYFKARLIGNGAIPHLPQTEQATQTAANGASCTAVRAFNHGKLSDVVAISTFALLSFDGESCVAEYINEDGSYFYRETLSGGKNSELI